MKGLRVTKSRGERGVRVRWASLGTGACAHSGGSGCGHTRPVAGTQAPVRGLLPAEWPAWPQTKPTGPLAGMSCVGPRSLLGTARSSPDLSAHTLCPWEEGTTLWPQVPAVALSAARAMSAGGPGVAACGTHPPAPLPALGGPVPTHRCPFLTPSCPAVDLELLKGTLLGAPLGTINIPGSNKWVLASFLSGCLPPCLVSGGVRGRLQGCLPCLNLGELLLCDPAVEVQGAGTVNWPRRLT